MVCANASKKRKQTYKASRRGFQISLVFRKRTPHTCRASTDPSRRLIEPFQAGETPTFISHIKAGLENLASDNTRLLFFSGGATKRNKTSLSEATSYRNLALANDLFGHPASLASRILTDDNATDSFQNVLLPLVEFSFHAAQYQEVEKPEDQNKKKSRTFPEHLTIIGHGFKCRRFEELHLPAVRWPKDPVRFRYVGIDPPMDEKKKIEVLNGEMLRGYGAWQKDLYGAGEVLANKRKARGWTADKKKDLETVVRRGWQHSAFKDDILALLMWNGGASGQELYPGRLPWAELES